MCCELLYHSLALAVIKTRRCVLLPEAYVIAFSQMINGQRSLYLMCSVMCYNCFEKTSRSVDCDVKHCLFTQTGSGHILSTTAA